MSRANFWSHGSRFFFFLIAAVVFAGEPKDAGPAKAGAKDLPVSSAPDWHRVKGPIDIDAGDKSARPKKDSPLEGASKPAAVKSGGWGGSGGGHGVACFANKNDVALFDRTMAAEGHLTDELRQKIVKLEALEYWEYKKEHHFRPLFAHRPFDYLVRMRERVEKYSPIFASRLALATSAFVNATWVPDDKLKLLDDAHPVRDIARENPLCRRVPLIERLTNQRPGRLPELSPHYDQWLFAHKLDKLNYAIMMTHENLYVIAYELVHRNSDALRPFVVELFSEDFWDKIDNYAKKNSQTMAARAFQARAGQIYGDYFEYFLDDPGNQPLGPVPAGFTPYSRYKSFGVMVKIMRARKHNCLVRENLAGARTNAERARIDSLCADEAFTYGVLAPLFNDEEAFMFTTRFFMDPFGVFAGTSETLVVFDREHPGQNTRLQIEELFRACRFAFTIETPENCRALVEKAQNYCVAIKLDYRQHPDYVKPN